MRIISCVKELEAMSIGKQVREGAGRKRASKSEEKARDGVEAETEGKGRGRKGGRNGGMRSR